VSLRILVVHPITKNDTSADDDIAGSGGIRSIGSVYEEIVQTHAKKVVRKDTEVAQWFPDKYSGSLTNLYLATVNNLPLVNRIIEAEGEGYDAVVAGCHADTGVQTARAVVHIPVIGPFEASLAVGSFIGEKFALITTREQYLRLLEYNIRLFGFEDRFIKNRPIRWPEINIWNDIIDAHLGKPERFIALIEKLALECVRDGADTVLVPGFPFGAALSMAGYNEVATTGVPIVEGAAAAYKMAEALADLRQSIGLSRTRAKSSQYQQFPRRFVDRALKEYGFRNK
jgi:allantoin racemase